MQETHSRRRRRCRMQSTDRFDRAAKQTLPSPTLIERIKQWTPLDDPQTQTERI